MRHDGMEDIVGTTRVVDEEPVLAELIVDGKRVRPIGEVDPPFRDAVRQQLLDDSPVEITEMVSKLMPHDELWQRGKLARAVGSAVVSQGRQRHSTVQDRPR